MAARTNPLERKTPPPELGVGGAALWRAIMRDHELDAVQVVQLLEACRAKDRLDKLDAVLTGDAATWTTIVPVDLEGIEFRLQVAGALEKANSTANTMKQLLVAIRLPDAEGKRPQRRGPRGAQKPTVPGGRPTGKSGTVSSIDRARERSQQSS